jgi:hypothetical protein
LLLAASNASILIWSKSKVVMKRSSSRVARLVDLTPQRLGVIVQAVTGRFTEEELEEVLRNMEATG